MKISKIAVAVATAGIVTVSTQAAVISGGALNGRGTNNSDIPNAGVGSVPIAIVVPGDVHNALQAMQGFPAACIGSRTKLCAPNLSSAEVRAILNGSLTSAAAISGDGTLQSNFGTPDNFTGVLATGAPLFRVYSANVADGLQQFTGSDSINGSACGSGASLGATGFASADDASTLSTIAAGFKKARVGFVHATELDDNQDVGFVKLDGSAPDLVNHLSDNYNMVSNLHGASVAGITVAAYGTVFGSEDGAGGAPYHNNADAYVACAPIDSSSDALDATSAGL